MVIAMGRPEDGLEGSVGRMGSPEEIARMMVFLASPASGFMTGAIVLAHGGYTAR
jgi:NAD(P)-dependent dehydrogenase (short-subunit alcohol dehydrogenase family)